MEAAGLRFLNNLPCLAEQTGRCTNPQCQFQHRQSSSEPAGATSRPATAKASNIRPETPVNEEDGPRKRQRIYTALGDSLPRPLSSPISSTYITAERAAATLVSRDRAITPPPLKRKADKISSETKSEKPPMAVAKVAATPVPRKAETLNPRHLRNAPAPHNLRLQLLQALYCELSRLNMEVKKDHNDEEAKLVLPDQELVWLALDIEEKLATSKPHLYRGRLGASVVGYKRMKLSTWKAERLAELKKKEEVPAAGGSQVPPPLGEPKVIETGLTPEQEVEVVKQLVTPITDLSAFGYVPVAPDESDMQKARDAEEASKGFEVCDRCKSRFQVFPGRREEDGALTSGGKCTYHWGKLYYPQKQAGDTSGGSQRRYMCCGTAVGDMAGCTEADTHVFKTTDAKRLALVLPFRNTPLHVLAPKNRAVCFDCEMGYTTKGLELIRITATAWPTEEELLDILVQPIGEVLDLNSRWSGVWPEDMLNAEPWIEGGYSPTPTTSQQLDAPKKQLRIVSSPAVARDLLFSLIAPETPLIGHGLENDLNATRIVHPTLVDTVLLFPHPRGLPVRNALRILALNHLNRRIQVEDPVVAAANAGRPQGHDSAEDARAAGQLVLLKVRDEWARLKKLGWKFGEEGRLVAPMSPPTDIDLTTQSQQPGGVLTEAFLENGKATPNTATPE